MLDINGSISWISAQNHHNHQAVSKIKLTLYHTILTFNDPIKKKKKIENMVTGENAGNQHFLLFP